MEMKLLTRDRYSEIFQNHMKRDFAADELKPLSMMYDMLARGIYEGYGFYEDGQWMGYVFLVLGKGDCALVDYLAICPEFRNQGCGSRFLDALAEMLTEEKRAPGGLILESEKPEAGKTEADRVLRARRIGFYERNSFRRTSLACELFGVAYTIMYRPAGHTELEDAGVYRELGRIYEDMGLMKYREQVRLRERDV
ncbi:MAG: GNAT family N-acetyltransferase [Lachnospiraceae bacterium]|nr:GNAT family N-acetyltransferase [Lachnospiraceae bacterium]